MKINIGANIKELRKINGITQEKLAEYLGVTYQTVSKWENSTSLPSISLLPIIANIFEVSVDELYDLNKNSKDSKIAEYESEYATLCKNGDNQGRINLMRKALTEYPNNFTFINYLARSLYRCENTDSYSEEIILLCERILEDCKIDSIRFSALQTIARTYNKIGQHETALKYAYEIPSMISSREFVLSEILTGEERIRQLQENIFHLTYNAGKAITYLASDYYGMGSSLAYEDKIHLCETANTLYKTIIDDGNYLILNGKFYWHYCWIAQNYSMLGDTANAMKNLFAAENAAIAADKYIEAAEEKKYTSLCLNRLTANPRNMLKHWQGTNCSKLYTMLQDKHFDLIRDNPDFKALEQRLKEKKEE